MKSYYQRALFGYTFGMRERRPVQLLTLVLVALAPQPARAAPAPIDPKLEIPAEDAGGAPEKAPAEKIETIDIAPAPGGGAPGGVVGGEYFFPYRESMSPRLGAILDGEGGERALYSVGFQLLYQTRTLRSYEGGLDLVSDGTGRAHFARRWFHARSRLRPYSKAGLGVKLIPKDGLATVLKPDNWQARGAVGLERLLLAPLSFRCELEAALGTGGFELALTAGYSWAW